MLSLPLRSSTTASNQEGFTLLETIIALLLITITVLGSATVTNFATRQFRDSARLNELNALVETDLAEVRTANDRLICNNLAVTTNCQIAGSDPDRNTFFPALGQANSIANITSFNNLCAATTATTGFANQFKSQYLDLNPPTSGPNNPIFRNVVLENGGHRYTVIYTRNSSTGPLIRQVTLVPTTVAWCPNQIQ